MTQRTVILWIGTTALACIVGMAVSFAALSARSWVPSAGTAVAVGDATDAGNTMTLIRLDAATTGIRWAGYSTTTYNGLLGGIGFKSANQICNTNYPGSHWAGTDEIIHLGTQYPWSLTAWLADYYYDGTKDCSHFSTNAAGQSATIADTKTIYAGGINSGWQCSNSLYLACVYQP